MVGGGGRGRGPSSSPRCLLLVSSLPTDRREIFQFPVFASRDFIVWCCGLCIVLYVVSCGVVAFPTVCHRWMTEDF